MSLAFSQDKAAIAAAWPAPRREAMARYECMKGDSARLGRDLSEDFTRLLEQGMLLSRRPLVVLQAEPVVWQRMLHYHEWLCGPFKAFVLGLARRISHEQHATKTAANNHKGWVRWYERQMDRIGPVYTELLRCRDELVEMLDFHNEVCSRPDVSAADLQTWATSRPDQQVQVPADNFHANPAAFVAPPAEQMQPVQQLAQEQAFVPQQNPGEALPAQLGNGPVQPAVGPQDEMWLQIEIQDYLRSEAWKTDMGLLPQQEPMEVEHDPVWYQDTLQDHVAQQEPIEVERNPVWFENFLQDHVLDHHILDQF